MPGRQAHLRRPGHRPVRRHDVIGAEGIDLAILPIGDNYTMGPDDAVRAVKLIQPKKVLPIHYNTWPVIAQDAAAWAVRVKKETKAEPCVVEPGGWVDV